MDQEVKTIVDRTIEACNTLKESLDKQKGRIDSLEQEKINKVTEDITKAAEQIQAVELKNKANEERIKDMELSLAKGNSSTKDDEVLTSDEKDEYGNLLQKEYFCGRQPQIYSFSQKFMVPS